MLTDEQVETYLRCTIGETSQRCKKCMNFEQWDDDMQCEFGPEQAKALLSDRAELKAEIASLLAETDAAGWYEAEYKIADQERQALRAETERLRAVAKAARWVTPYIPDVGETTYCHPMHHGYHGGQFHTVYVTKREQEQFFEWAENFRDALAALESEASDD